MAIKMIVDHDSSIIALILNDLGCATFVDGKIDSTVNWPIYIGFDPASKEIYNYIVLYDDGQDSKKCLTDSPKCENLFFRIIVRSKLSKDSRLKQREITNKICENPNHSIETEEGLFSVGIDFDIGFQSFGKDRRTKPSLWSWQATVKAVLNEK